ncbi:MAG: hypothetical protein KDB23_11105 [Planctomycetales bacterium]|nr:hypothetical protein [Planctomycetales bacterium]
MTGQQQNETLKSTLGLELRRELQQRLQGTRGRERRWRALQIASVVFAVCAGVGLLVNGLLAWQGDRLFHAPEQLRDARMTFVAAPFAFAGLCAIIAWLRPRSYAQIARLIDERCGLLDRIGTAWWFASKRDNAGFERLQVVDALQHLTTVRPQLVIPAYGSRYWILGAVVWLASLLVSQWQHQAVATLTQRVERQRAQDATNATLAEQLENTLLKDLQKMAELTGMTPQENLTLRELARDVEQKLEQLKQQGASREESLAVLSEIQASVSRASSEFNSAAVETQMQELANKLTAAESMDSVAEAMQQQDYEQAASNLEQADPQQLNDLERVTLADELQAAADEMKSQQLDQLADATQAWQEAMSQNDSAAMSTAAQQMAAQMRQQASRAAIEAALQEQLASLAEAKGQSRSGGSNIDLSTEDRSTFGRGKAGDPLQDEQTPLATDRQREELQGAAGEGPSERETMSSETADIVSTRDYQAKYDQYRRMAESALKQEALPLGHRQTIRRYFESLRPE